MYLDAGTNNERYLHDPLYLGMRKARPATEELYSFVDEFVEAVQEVFPMCCIHSKIGRVLTPWTCSSATATVLRLQRRRQGTAGITSRE